VYDAKPLSASRGVFDSRDFTVHELDQGWSDETRDLWYTTSQGSRMVPYDWYLVLERPGDDTPFNSPAVYARYGYPGGTAADLKKNELPLGFVMDLSDEQWAIQFPNKRNQPELDTTVGGEHNKGNRASGHLYGTQLDETERAALLEYLKSL
jgi:hypothetical protein